jgi:hypothetical protein
LRQESASRRKLRSGDIPERYNELYEQFTKKQNLNHLLEWGTPSHRKSLAKYPCDYAIADQFGDENIFFQIDGTGKEAGADPDPRVNVPGVAAASILRGPVLSQ